VKHLVRFAALACAVTCAACGGGGGGSSAPPVVATATPTATAAPTPVPTATPVPVLPQASATTIPFASNQPVTLTVTETGYAGAFGESDTCAPLTGTIATVHANATSGTASYTVTPVGPGACSITVRDTAGGAVTVPVTVSTLALTVQ
jgi:hypothetical protein